MALTVMIDWDFLNTYCVGFDLDHMPADAKLDECISEYVQGKYDGVPKTPEWASETIQQCSPMGLSIYGLLRTLPLLR